MTIYIYILIVAKMYINLYHLFINNEYIFIDIHKA